MTQTHSIDKKVNYKTDDHIFQIHEYDLDIASHQIYLMGSEDYAHPDMEGEEPGVEYVMANRFIRNINILQRKTDEPILIHLKTDGGFWEEGMAIYDAIKACPNRVVILNYTHARSMSSLIFSAADKRVMMPHSTFMLHDGTFGFSGTVKQARTEMGQLEATNDIMYNIYIDRMKEKGKMKSWSRRRIREWLERETQKKEEVYFSAKEAVAHGFADEIFGANGHYNWRALTHE